MSESTVVVHVDDELKSAFAEAAKASDRTASQLLRDFMRDFVKSHAESAEYDAWFRQEVNEGITDARAGRVRPSEAVEAHFAKRRATTSRRVGNHKR